MSRVVDTMGTRFHANTMFRKYRQAFVFDTTIKNAPAIKSDFISLKRVPPTLEQPLDRSLIIDFRAENAER